MHRNRKWIFAMFPLISLITLESSYSQPFYKWVDDHGVMQYTQTPPPHVRKVAANAQPSKDSTYEIKNRNDRPIKSMKMSPDEEQAAENARKNSEAESENRNKNTAVCQQLRLNLAQLKSGQRFRTIDGNGDQSFLSEEQKAAQIKQQTVQIQNYCPQ